MVAWLAVLDGRFFSKIFACRRVEPEGAGSSPARPTNKLKVESWAGAGWIDNLKFNGYGTVFYCYGFGGVLGGLDYLFCAEV